MSSLLVLPPRHSATPAHRLLGGWLNVSLCIATILLLVTGHRLRANDGLLERGVTLAQTTAETASQSSSTTKPADRTSTSQTGKQQTAKGQTATDEQEAVGKSADAERKVLEFVRQHQPKLLKLLEFLETRQPTLYAQAVREMSRSQQRLESLAKRDAELHAVELQLWQVRSELRLLAAEMTVASKERESPNSLQTRHGRERHLTELVEQEATHELSRLQLLKARAEKELARLDAQIGVLSESREEQVARKVQLWQNRITKSSR